MKIIFLSSYFRNSTHCALRQVAGGIACGGSTAICNRRGRRLGSRNDRGIEGVLVVCLSGDGWFDLDETFELLEFENLLVKVLVLGIVPFDLFITRIVLRAGVII